MPTVQQPLLLPDEYRAIRDLASGERPLVDFTNILAFSGFAPSAGANQVGDYLAATAKEVGLTHVGVERFPSDGDSYVWAFRREPYWEVKKGELWLVDPELQRLSDFRVMRTCVARNSRTGSETAELVDVGSGVRPEDYSGLSVAGKIVLATGPVSSVMRAAVWERGALGVVGCAVQDPLTFPDQVAMMQIVPWVGPLGEPPTFAFSISYRALTKLKQRLAGGEKLILRAEVEAECGHGEYPVVRGEIAGTEPTLPAILVNAHSNFRNAGGANNLTGVGCTLEVARILSQLIGSGVLKRPRRTIRFMWGAEHYGVMLHFHRHPEDVANILAMINVDMIGYNQQTSGAVLTLYRSPESNPAFVDDIVEAFLEKIGRDNTSYSRYAKFLSPQRSDGYPDPIFAPTGSRAPLRYKVDPFWGPSDHEDVQALGIKAILLGNSPDVFISTQDDSVAAADSTQMRRGVVLAAAASYFLAAASSEHTELLLDNAFSRALKRLIDDQTKAHSYLFNATGTESLSTSYCQAENLLKHSYRRETVGLETLGELVGGDTFAMQISPYLKHLIDEHEKSLVRLKHLADIRAKALHLSTEAINAVDAALDPKSRTPKRTDSIRGPVNLVRPEYGWWWLVDKTGDEDFEAKVPLSQRGQYMAFEALNFADGKRTVKQIRDALSAEYDPVTLADVDQFFDFMAGVGVIKWQP